MTEVYTQMANQVRSRPPFHDETVEGWGTIRFRSAQGGPPANRLHPVYGTCALCPVAFCVTSQTNALHLSLPEWYTVPLAVVVVPFTEYAIESF